MTEPTWRKIALITHACVIAALAVLQGFAVSWDDGSGLGVGLVAMPLGLLGLPWSIPGWIYLEQIRDALGLAGVVVVYAIAPALLNVAFHWLMHRHWRRTDTSVERPSGYD